jgi:eukaryotic-like serine/threonine-protein kinase
VAIKVMLSRIAVDERSRHAFLREIDSMKALQHEHIVPLFEHGSTGTAFYFVMEYCDGGSLGDLIRSRSGKVSLSEAEPIMLHALDGLAFAHKQGYVHRDLKPDNVLLVGIGTRRVAKVSDFGLSKNFQIAGFSGHTITGSYGGTPMFMPREQVVNFRYMKPVSDVWGMAATFYFMLTGQSPRQFVQDVDPIQIILQERVVPIRERDPKVPRRLAEVIDRSLSNDVKERYQDALDMRVALSNAF